MKSTRISAAVLCSALCFSLTPGLVRAQEGKGREAIGGVLKAILEARREQERGQSATTVTGPVDLNAFRTALGSYRRELDVLSAAALKSGTQGFRSLSPQIVQLQNRAKFSDAYLSRETRLDLCIEHCNGLEKEWLPISEQVRQLRGLDRSVYVAASNLDDLTDGMWRSLGKTPTGQGHGQGYPHGSGVGSEARILVGLLDREIQTLYDQISFRQLLALAPQQSAKLMNQAGRLSSACVALDKELTKNGKREVCVASHRALQQEWTSFQTLVRAEKGLRLEAACERVESYVAELGDLLTGAGPIPGAPGYPPSGGALGQGLTDLVDQSTRLEVLASDLVEVIRRDGEYFRNEALRSQLVAQSTEFLHDAQSFRRSTMRPALDRKGQVDLTQFRRTWEETALSWQKLSSALDQLSHQVRRADRYFPEMFRAQDDIAESVAGIQASLK